MLLYREDNCDGHVMMMMMTKILFRKSNEGRVDKITTISKDIQDCDMLPKDIAKIP